jgi:hypothetical protein
MQADGQAYRHRRVNRMSSQRPYEQYRREREQWERQQAADLDAARAQNQKARDAYLKGLEDEKTEKAARDLAALDAELAPDRTRLQREWLAINTGKTEQDFLRHAWPHLRANLVEQREHDHEQELYERTKASGLYHRF